MEQVAEEKKRIRLLMKELTSSLSLEVIQHESAAAVEHFLSSELFLQADCILSYMAMKNEINPLVITECALREQKIVALPRIIPHTNEMQFYKISNAVPLEAQLELGMWGIREPHADKAALFAPTMDMSRIVVVVPGVAFSNNGLRLGHGKGYYDKYLSALQQQCAPGSITCVGMCLSEQKNIVVPTDRYDFKMDYLLSPSELHRC